MDYYLDTEFNSLGGKLISMGLVRQDGKGLYLVYPRLPSYTPWVNKNVMPHLFDVPAGIYPIEATWSGSMHRSLVSVPNATGPLLQEFFKNDPAPHVITDWPDDIKYFCEELLVGPGLMVNVPRISFEVKRVDAWPFAVEGARQHNAYWDALALREKCLELTQEHIESGAYMR